MGRAVGCQALSESLASGPACQLLCPETFHPMLDCQHLSHQASTGATALARPASHSYLLPVSSRGPGRPMAPGLLPPHLTAKQPWLEGFRPEVGGHCHYRPGKEMSAGSSAPQKQPPLIMDILCHRHTHLHCPPSSLAFQKAFTDGETEALGGYVN